MDLSSTHKAWAKLKKKTVWLFYFLFFYKSCFDGWSRKTWDILFLICKTIEGAYLGGIFLLSQFLGIYRNLWPILSTSLRTRSSIELRSWSLFEDRHLDTILTIEKVNQPLSHSQPNVSLDWTTINLTCNAMVNKNRRFLKQFDFRWVFFIKYPCIRLLLISAGFINLPNG